MCYLGMGAGPDFPLILLAIKGYWNNWPNTNKGLYCVSANYLVFKVIVVWLWKRISLFLENTD